MSDIVRFQYASPDRDKHPDNQTRGLKVTFREVTVTISWNLDEPEDLALLAHAMPRVMAQVQEMEDANAKVHEESKNLDSELAALLDEEVEE